MADAFEIRLGTTSPALRYDFPAGFEPHLAAAKEVRFVMPPFIDREALIIGPLTIEHQWETGDTSVLGTFPAWVRLIYPDDSDEIVPSGEVIPVRVW